VREGRVITVLFPCLPWSGHKFGGQTAANLSIGGR